MGATESLWCLQRHRHCKADSKCGAHLALDKHVINLWEDCLEHAMRVLHHLGVCEHEARAQVSEHGDVWGLSGD